MTPLPKQFAYLDKIDGMPRMVAEARRLFGTLETPGTADNPVILRWADEVAAAQPTAYNRWAGNWYNDDSTPWCGLFMAVCAIRSNPDKRPERMPPNNWLAAASWSAFGVPVPISALALGDICVKARPGGNHVFIYVGESPNGETIYGLGGNQGDAVSIAPFKRKDVTAARRVPFLNKPAAVKKYVTTATGLKSVSEA